MGNLHPTEELIRSITEYIDARYESFDRVASYEVDQAEAMFAKELEESNYSPSTPEGSFGSAFPGSAPAMKSAPPDYMSYSAPAPAYGKKKSALRRLFSKSVRPEESPEEGRKASSPMPMYELDDAAVGSAPDISYSTVNARSLEDLVNNPAESFAAMLFRLIDEKGLSDPDVYNKAGVSRQTFSKIRSREDYAPSKDTVIALALALGLGLDETQDLLNTAGFALSNSSKADIVVSYFLEHGYHDLDYLNETLYDMGFAIIGGK